MLRGCLRGCLHLSMPIRWYIEDLCISLYINFALRETTQKTVFRENEWTILIRAWGSRWGKGVKYSSI